ncbi:MAG: hypothetical protein AABW83_01990, partial [Nanoarchaeota archaeon]
MNNKKIEKVFGKEETRIYILKRNIFFALITLFFIIGFFLRRYFNFLTELRYLKLVNLVSFLGLIIAIFIFHLADKMFNLNLRKRDYFFMYFMSIMGIILSFLYFKLPNYDKIEHFIFPMMFASITYHILSRKLSIPFKWKLFFTFFIIIGFLSIFELVEYFLDFLFDWRLQGVFIEEIPGNYREILARIDDTMLDILIGITGTLV